MRGIPGSAALPRSARPVARAAWRGLIQVLAGSDPPPGQRPRWRGQRWAAGITLAAVTLLLYSASPGVKQAGHHGSVNFSNSGGAPGTPVLEPLAFARGLHTFLLSQPPVETIIIMVVVVVPLPLVIRWPLLSWRIGWLGLLLIPLLALRWQGGLPWDPAQVPVMLAAVCAAGVRHERAVLCWLWALTLLPWWLWAYRDGVSMTTAALGTAAFAAMAVAVDSVSSRRRAQQALADQAERADLERAQRAVSRGAPRSRGNCMTW